MRITTSQLRRIIKEEAYRILSESSNYNISEGVSSTADLEDAITEFFEGNLGVVALNDVISAFARAEGMQNDPGLQEFLDSTARRLGYRKPVPMLRQISRFPTRRR